MSKVSILMGIYNCNNPKELEDSVKSIINQTFTDWELIICNDGSIDNTLHILNQIAKMDNRIRVVSYNKNQGLAYALNYAYKFAKGEYIARQDGDDISYPQRISKQIEYLDKNNDIDFVGTIADVYDNNGIWGTFSLVENPQIHDFLWNSPFIHPSILMRRIAFEKAGLYRVSWETRRCEDYDLFMAMYSCGSKGANIQEKLYKYKVENGNKKYRKMRDRLEESVVRMKGFRKMNIGIKGIPYIFKPIIIGLIPQKIFGKIREKQYS
ncbi:glycosyltransferase [Clostridium sp. D43t1_170807_H7]|uniref:glycosyltransferase n=1 Tax=Clostridium sp. D43t1_170807_H7 TaxID=2787140 RepID=UPI00189BBF32|nr:glycosyltransferase [Clostridium sp. D43t1_170807_H7]